MLVRKMSNQGLAKSGVRFYASVSLDTDTAKQCAQSLEPHEFTVRYTYAWFGHSRAQSACFMLEHTFAIAAPLFSAGSRACVRAHARMHA